MEVGQLEERGTVDILAIGIAAEIMWICMHWRTMKLGQLEGQAINMHTT